MNLELITQASLETVGTVQVLKNFLPESFPKKLWAVIMPILAVGFTLVETYLSSIIGTCILVVCCSQIGYESILQTLKKLGSIIGSKDVQ